MKKSELPGAEPLPPRIPVICDRCRATGDAGEDPFADLADLLSFTPVPRRPHVNGWDAEMQRAFIAALATTGSPRRAARALGKHSFGADQLRKARGGSSFAAAWDAALDIARECELAGLRDGLSELAAENQEERHRRRAAILPKHQRQLALPDPDPGALLSVVEGPGRGGRRLTKREEEDAEFDAQREDYLAERIRIRDRLTRARRLYLAGICDDPAKRAAWELLVGPVDWDSAERFGPQADEPFADPECSGYDIQPHSFVKPALLMTAEAGFLADVTGGPDALAELRRLVEQRNNSVRPEPVEGSARTSIEQDGSPSPSEAALPPEEQAAITAHREELKAKGWTEDDEGNLWLRDDED